MSSSYAHSKEIGIPVRIDWTAVAILLLTVWALADLLFKNLYPEWAWLSGGAAGLLALLFFAALLVHELAHALTAIATGRTSYPITLLARERRRGQAELASASSELASAIIGPLTSLLLGAFFLWLGAARFASETAGQAVALSPIAFILFWLAGVNLVLGVVNLIPAVPLDGGQVLCILLWAMADDREQGLQWSATVGRLAGWSLIALGLVLMVADPLPLFGIAPAAGVGLVLSGWFLTRAALPSRSPDALGSPSGERAQAIPPNIPVSSLINDYILGSDEAVCPVIDHGRLVGLVHLGDVRKVPLERWDVTEVGEIMVSAREPLEV